MLGIDMLVRTAGVSCKIWETVLLITFLPLGGRTQKPTFLKILNQMLLMMELPHPGRNRQMEMVHQKTW